MSFSYSSQGEPHSFRRIEILKKHPDIEKLNGYDLKTAWVTAACVLVQLSLAAGFGWAAKNGHWLGVCWLVVIFSYFGGAIISHWLAMAVHEAAHNLAARTTLQNRWVALLANVPIPVPMAMTFRRYHLNHHFYLGNEEQDTDLPTQFEIRFIGNSRFRKFLWLLFYFLVYALRGILVTSKKPKFWEVVNVLLQVPITIAIGYFFGEMALIYLCLSFFFGMSLHPVAAHFIHEHYSFEPEQETYSYYGPLNWVTFNVGYHVEHHDFMNVPGWDLPKLHNMAPEYYQPLVSHTSWTGILWRFIFDPGMSPASRIVRTKNTFQKGLREARGLTLDLQRQKKKAAHAVISN